MHIIKLNAIDSTNSYLKKLSSETSLRDYTVVITNNQTNGRGQMGAVWDSEGSKNLTFSVFKDVSNFYIDNPFFISIVVSLSILKALQSINIQKLSVKWPNDILSDNKKVCGILIENVIKQNNLQSSIIGVGLNVNQTTFNNLPSASSIKCITGIHYHLDEVLQSIIVHLKNYFSLLQNGHYEDLKQEYETYLFRKNKPSTFKGGDGNIFSGIIKNVSAAGHLQVLLEDDIVKAFDLKEITLLY
ncbi:ligase [Pseudalgibacter alginicilyticus]|uniref:Ligase n=1 Tax=Pseudalgibacter alginicilyticus TaxID=1736674 RepID=A0A0P0CJ08_9FLAO|nr:biotin--[acetyl-CoA-carboxylase] ligase [Pseudalgibacter alginicilyticus]ALJ06201.1 ligase [Pseudalgibacter alginicilyticus]